VQGHQTGFAELAFPNDQQNLVPIYITGLEPHRLGDAQPSASQQTDQRLPSVGLELALQPSGATEQLVELGPGVEVRGAAPVGRS
jgi:hypothetical protein